MLNLHFFNPYLKNTKSVFSYQLILKIFAQNTEEENNRFLASVINYIKTYKKNLYEKMEEGIESEVKLLPMFHILIYLFTYFNFSDKDLMRTLA